MLRPLIVLGGAELDLPRSVPGYRCAGIDMKTLMLKFLSFGLAMEVMTMKALALGLAILVANLSSEANAGSFYGSFICEFAKITLKPATSGVFVIGDQIFFGVNEFELSWVGLLGPGLTYKCRRTGNILVCPLGEAKEYIALNLKQPNSVFDTDRKIFVRAVAIFQEEWRCTRFKLGYQKTVNPSDPE